MGAPPLPPRAIASGAEIFPLTTIAPTRSYEFALLWQRMLRDIGSATAGSYTPSPRSNVTTNPIATGTITGITSTGFTDSGAGFIADPKRCGVSNPYSQCKIQIYYLDDTRNVAVVGLQTNTSGTSMNFSTGTSARFGSPKDWVQRGVIGDPDSGALSKLIGANYAIIAADDIGPYDRWEDPPNDIEFVSLNGSAGSYAIFPTSLVSCNASSGNFNLSIGTSYSTATTDNMPWNVSASTLQSTIIATSSMNGSNCAVANYSGGFAVAFDAALLPATITLNGSNLSGGTVTISALFQLLLDVNQKWPSGQFNQSQPSWPTSPTSFDLMIYNNGTGVTNPLVRRLTISANGPNNISTGSLGDFVPTLPTLYSVVAHNGWWAPLNIGGHRNPWTTSASDSTYGVTHMPDGSIGSYPQAALLASYDPGDDPPDSTTGCLGPSSTPLFDIDVINECCDPWCCGPAYMFFNPNLWKSARSKQIGLIDACSEPWVDPAWGDGAKARPVTMLFPIAAVAAGVPGSFTTSISSVSSDGSKAYIGTTIPYSMAILYWAEKNASTGGLVQGGQTVLSNDSTGTFIPGNWNSGQVGDTIVGTYGFDNKFEYQFARLTDDTIWIPSQKEDGTLVDPPQLVGGACPVPYIGTPSMAQSASGPSVSTSVNVIGPTSSLVVFTICSGTDPGSVAISDSQGQTWNYLGSQNTSSGSQFSSGVYYVSTALQGVTNITFSPSGRMSLTIVAVETNGTAGAVPIDVSASAASNGTSVSAGSLTTTQPNDLLLCFGSYFESIAQWTAGTGCTMSVSTTDPTISAYALEYQKAVTPGSYATGFSISAGQPNLCWSIAMLRGTQTGYLGTFVTRPASTNYRRFDLGTGQPYELGPAFVDGDLARYTGQFASDPTLPDFNSTSLSPYAAYQDNFYVGTNGASPNNPIFAGKVLDPVSGNYYSTNVDAQGTGTGLMTASVSSFNTTSGQVSQISISPTVGNNWMQRGYSTADDLSTTLTGTTTDGSASTIVSGSTFDMSVWGCPISITNVSGGAVWSATVDGSNISTGTLHFTPPSPWNVSSGCVYSIVRPGCVNYYHFMNATSGSSTTFADSTQAADPRLDNRLYGCGRLLLRAYEPVGDGSQKLHKFRINGTTQSTGTLLLDPVDGVAISAGWIGEIDWAKHEQSTMQGLWATASGGANNASGTMQVLANDQSTLVFNTSTGSFTNVSNGSVISLTSYLPNSVLRWNASHGRWIQPTGRDNRIDITSGNHPNFPKDPRYGFGFVFSWYGLIHQGTLNTIELWNQMYDVAEQFKVFLTSGEWYANAVAGTPEVYWAFGGGSGGFGTWDGIPGYFPGTATDFPTAAAEALAQLATEWMVQDPYDGPLDSSYAGPSTYSFGGNGIQFDISGNVLGGYTETSASAFSGYYRVTGINNDYASSVAYYCFGAAVSSCAMTTDPVLGPPLGENGNASSPCLVTYDSYGQPVDWHVWNKWSTGTIDTSGNSVSSKLGDTGEPPAPSLPGTLPVFAGPSGPYPYYEQDGYADEGFAVTDTLGLIEVSLPAISG